MKKPSGKPRFPSRCYFTLIDRKNVGAYREEEGAQTRAVLERNLKSALLFQDQTVVRASAALEVEDSLELLTEYSSLIQEGVIIPETRKNDGPLIEQYERKGDKAAFLAELFDRSEAIPVDADELAAKRSKELCYQIARLIHLRETAGNMLRPETDWEDLDRLQGVLYGDNPIPDRRSFEELVGGMFGQAADGLRLIQSIYFGLGAGEVNANPVWSRSTDPKLHRSFWESSQLDPTKLGAAAARTVAHAPFSDLVEERRTLVTEQRVGILADEIAESLHIPPLVLDLLDLTDIKSLRDSTVGRSSQDVVNALSKHLCSSDDPQDLVRLASKRFEQEHRKYKSVSATLKWTGIGLGALGLIPQIGIMCTGAGIALALGGTAVVRRLTPLRSFSEMIRERELEGRQDQRA